MSAEIEVHRKIKFTSDIMQLAQQQGSALMDAVSKDMNVDGKQANYQQLGATVASEITARHADTQYTPTPHRRRWLTCRRWAVADLIDEHDLVRVVANPSAAYAQAFGWAIGRAIDDAIIAAFFASAQTGEDASTSTAHPATHQIASGSVGMTIAKLRNARQILEASQEPEDEGNKWYIALNARLRRDLLATTEVTSADFNSVKALVNGQINEFLGFTFLKSERLGLVSTERAVPVWTRNAMKLGFNQTMKGDIEELPGKNYSTQVFFRADFGATRMNETGVVRILCTES